MKFGPFETVAPGILPLAAVLLLTAACSPPEGAAEAPQNEPVETATTGVNAGQAGLRASIDPETGQLTSRPADGAGLQSAVDPLNWSSEGLQREVLPDGTVRVDLQGRFMSSSYAVRQPDGPVRVEHAPPPELSGAPESPTGSNPSASTDEEGGR